MKRMFVIVASVAAVGAIALPATSPAARPKNLVQTAQSAHRFKTFVRLVRRARLTATLSGTTKYTVFAPTDAAFARLSKSRLRALTANTATLRKVLLFHVVKGSFPESSVAKLKSLPTLEGSKLTISTKRGVVRLDRTATVARTNMRASDGIIHPINRVLVPSGVTL